MRVQLVLGESGNFPVAIKAVSEWFPKKERALAVGILTSGTSIGAILAPACVPWLAATYGWESAFVIQSGPLKDMSVRWRNSTLRRDFSSYDIDENRLIINYPIKFL